MLRGEEGEAVRESLCLYVSRATMRSLSGATLFAHLSLCEEVCVDYRECRQKLCMCLSRTFSAAI